MRAMALMDASYGVVVGPGGAAVCWLRLGTRLG